MTATEAVQHRTNGWFASYKGRQVRLASRPNDHNICHVINANFSGYAFLHELRTVTGSDGQPIVDPDFDPDHRD